VLIDHLVYAVPDLATAVADVTERFGVRAEPGGQHAGRGTHNALLALGLIPFLINWGDTEHPARSAPPGLVLESIQAEHPDPPALAPIFAALGIDIQVTRAPAPALVARLTAPNGRSVLR
jgi:Glyoxalase-like domain